MATIATPSYGLVNATDIPDETAVLQVFHTELVYGITNGVDYGLESDSMSVFHTMPAYAAVVTKVQDEFGTSLATRQTASNANFSWGH